MGLTRTERLVLGGIALATAAAAVAHYADAGPVLAFVVAGIALAGQAWMVSFATEQVGVERHTETDQRQVTTDVSHEEVELEEDGRRDSSDTYAADREITDPDDPSRRL